MNKYDKRLLKHADYMAALPKRAHDQGIIAKRGELSPIDAAKNGWRCGAAACVLGHLPVAQPKAWKYSENDSPEELYFSVELKVDPTGDAFNDGGKWFGLCSTCEDALFDAFAPHQTPKAAAKALRELATRADRKVFCLDCVRFRLKLEDFNAL